MAIALIMLNNRLFPRFQWLIAVIYLSLRGLQVNWETLVQAELVQVGVYKSIIFLWYRAGVQETKSDITSQCKASGCSGLFYIHTHFICQASPMAKSQVLRVEK